MASVTLKGNKFSIKDDIPAVGMEASDFTFVRDDLSEASLYDDFGDEVKVIMALPSIETNTCQRETRKFNEELGKRDGVLGIVISKDLPFTMRRFCAAEGIQNIIVGSDYRYNDFINEYNTEILGGPMKGLSARAVFVLDGKNIIQYSELVPEIGQEPQYEKALAVVDSLIGK